MKQGLTLQQPPISRTRMRLMGLCGVVAVALSLGLATPSSADTGADKRRLDAEIAQLRTVLEGTSQNLAQAFVELQRTKAELPAARQALNAADAAQAVADRRNEAVAASLALAKAHEAKARDALAQNALNSQKAQDRLGNMARDEYQQGEVSGLSIALEANSPADFTNRMIMVDMVTRIRRQMVRGLDTVRVQGQAGEAYLVAVRQQVAALKVQAGVALARATAARRLAATAKTRLDVLYAAQTRDAATVATKQATEIASVRKMQAQSDSLTRVLAARAKAASDRPQGGQHRSAVALLSYPVGFPVSSEFGLRFHPVLRIWRLHAGIDFAAPCGSPVYAAADGEVILATPVGQSGGYGNRLVISHGLHRGVDLTTTYNHLTSFAVTTGHVARGQLVAYSGNTGLSTGCHLHFETRENGTPVNPRSWF